jgi:signal transduction histidine kinase
VKLADFILSDMEAILAAWENFAVTLLPAAQDMNSLELRDHAQQILEAVAADIRTVQSADQQSAKSRGLAPVPLDAHETAAQTHAVLRARGGFDIRQLAAEYRALRASVLRLWAQRFPTAHAMHFEDVMRFNEAIDQALAESISHFQGHVVQARNLLLGMLGHDMRSPLQTIQITATHLARLNAGEAVSDAALRLIRSGSRMKSLLDDLVDFNRVQLGLGIRIAPAPMDLAALVTEVVAEIQAIHPASQIDLHIAAATPGTWDKDRLHQMLGNLILNAVTHGTNNTPVGVHLHEESAGDIVVEITNHAPVISAADLAQLFEPLRRGPAASDDATKDTGMGLGLFIACEVAKRHGGRIEARSDENETAFTVRLPRTASKH